MESTGINAALAVLSLMPLDNLRSELLRCCGSTGWVEGMVAKLPFATKDQLFEAATTVWWNLPISEWHMAFLAHPQIGTSFADKCLLTCIIRRTEFLPATGPGDASALKSKFAHSKWEGDEQKGANSASSATLEKLAALNAQYLAKNGFIFLICATGKTADEMVDALQLRMLNDKETEVYTAELYFGNLRHADNPILHTHDSYKLPLVSKTRSPSFA